MVEVLHLQRPRTVSEQLCKQLATLAVVQQ